MHHGLFAAGAEKVVMIITMQSSAIWEIGLFM
jgi:hypothetical protein